MALSAAKIWIDGEVFTHTDINAEIANILNNALALISPLTGALAGGDFEINNLKKVGVGTASPSAPGHFTDEDARTNTVAYNVFVGGTTSGTPAASIGTGLRIQAESGDENPSTLCDVDAIFTDVGAGAEDSDLLLKLREAGAAVAERFRIASDGLVTITGAGLTIKETDARTNTADIALDIQSNTTGTPAASIGTSIQLQAESADEDPSVLCEIRGIFTDIDAGDEDSDVIIMCRRAGAAVTEIARFVGLGGGITVAASAPATPLDSTLYEDVIIKAWAEITVSGGTPSISDDVNVSSVDDDDTGNFGCNFPTAFAGGSYGVGATALTTTLGDIVAVDDTSTGSLEFLNADDTGTAADFSFCFIAVGN